MSPPDPYNDRNDNPTEHTLLLPVPPHDAPQAQSSSPPSSKTTILGFPLAPHWLPFLTIATLAFLFNMGTNIAGAPSLAILQGIICRDYYEHGGGGVTGGLGHGGGMDGGGGGRLSFEDDKCKIAPVQSQVAEVQAWRDVWEIVPAVIMAIPFGVITDRIGRKKVLLLALFGILLNEVWVRLIFGFPSTFPIRLVWLGGLFQVIGGGSITFTSLAYVLVADVVPAEDRSIAFGYLLGSCIAARCIFVPLGGALISVDPWIAMDVGLLTEVVGFFVAAVFIRETLPADSAPSSPGSDDASGLGTDAVGSGSGFASGAESQLTLVGVETNGAVNGEEDGEEEMGKKQKSVKQRVESWLEKTQEAGRWTVKNPKVVLLLVCFWLYMMGEQAEQLLMIQYASKRLGWSLGKASLLPSLGSFTNLLTLLLLLPFLSSLLSPPNSPPSPSPHSRLKMSEPAKDTLLTQLLALLLLLGSLFISLPIPTFSFLASGEILYSVGAAVSVPMRSLITNLVDARHRATLYTVISVVTYAAVSVGRVVMAGLFGVGLKMGGEEGDGMRWMGLPFLVAGGMFGVVLGVVSLGGFGRGGLKEREGEEEEGLVVDREGVDEEGEGGRYRD
ncbi:major facilitator superfamily domain-containing protein [Sordaria brevicollis]|uniref:Major facilitator superfamily domain-containing protein n=1 Tax=Sordaria brevicollis TaxID=83679 RepID=A0AAE0U9G4_SORBR|nr:major facilitator superfamily domain-containing protein [Sordaria brevicollis]